MFRRLLYLALVVLSLAACKRDEPKPVSSGTFTYKGEKYGISMVRVEHADYDAEGRFVLRLTAYPGTYRINEKTTSGYGNVLNIYCVADANDFAPGVYSLAETDTLVSTLTHYPNTADNNAAHDTVAHLVAGGELEVSDTDTDRFMKYSFRLVDAGGDSITGTYTGSHVHNRVAVQPVYGQLVFDTVRCSLAAPSVIRWGKVFCSINYSEIVFYAADARFTDAGALSSGIQFAVGIQTDSTSSEITVGTYPVSTDYYTENATLYGHKVRNTSWGTYWQMMRSGSSVGRANILGGKAVIKEIADGTLTAEFQFTDQLKNTVSASYSGPYSTKNYSTKQ